jgi:hypothetical protein
LIKDGTVINKWSVNDLPDEYELTDSLDKLSIGKISQKTFIHKAFLALGWFVIPLAFLSIIDTIWETHKKE